MSPQEQSTLLSHLENYLDEHLITEILECVRGGKEATVFRCRAGARHDHNGNGNGAPAEFYAAKIYRPQERRSFRNDSAYQNGRVILNHRTRRAVQKKTDFGKAAHQGLWACAEYETQRLLWHRGVAVPRPIAFNGHAILMEWIGDEYQPAPQLRHTKLTPDQARQACDTLLDEIERMLDNHTIHGDLSPFNILYWQGRPRIIDFPQSADARMNTNAYGLLCRDVENVCRYFRKWNVTPDPYRIATRLWDRYVNGDLGREAPVVH
jgi:RIO kinase 1